MKLDKKALEGFEFIEVELHHTRATNDPKRLKRIQQRLTSLQMLAERIEKELRVEA